MNTDHHMGRMKSNDNPPLTREQLQASFDAHLATGLLVAWLGEDGEAALILGHHPQARDADISVALAASDWGSGEPDQYVGPFESRWLVAREHRDDCEEFLEEERRAIRADANATPEEIAEELESLGCNCDEYSWYGSYSKELTAQTPSAIAVTLWSA